MPKTLVYKVNFETGHGFSDADLTEEKKSELAFIHDYLCLSAILWAIENLGHYCQNEDTVTPSDLQNFQYLASTASSLLEDMSARMQREYFIGGRENA